MIIWLFCISGYRMNPELSISFAEYVFFYKVLFLSVIIPRQGLPHFEVGQETVCLPADAVFTVSSRNREIILFIL